MVLSGVQGYVLLLLRLLRLLRKVWLLSRLLQMWPSVSRLLLLLALRMLLLPPGAGTEI